MKNQIVKKKYLIIAAVGIVLLALLFLLIVLFANSEDEYSFLEKNWINSNVNNVIDINVPSDIPVFNSSGKGVFIDFVNDFELDTNLSLNVVSTNANYSFNLKNTVGDNDLVLYKDHYVLVSPDKTSITSVNDLKDQNVAVLSSDLSAVSEYMKDYSGIVYKSYASLKEVQNSFDEGVSYAIIPLYRYIDSIIYDDLNIVYHFDGLNYYYTLTMPQSDDRLNDIFTKFLNRWQEELKKSINSNLIDIYYTANELSDVQKESIVNDDYIVGYVENLPIEGKINREFNGLSNIYLKKFSEFTGATYKYVKYSSVNDLTNALNKKKIDLVYNYYSISNSNYETTVGLGNTKYVLLAHNSNNFITKSLSSLKNIKVKMVSGTNLSNYIEQNGAILVKYDNYDELFKNLNEDDLIIMEKESYEYYKNDKLSDYGIRLFGQASIGANYLMNVDNAIFNNLFEFYMTLISSEETKLEALNDTINEKNANILLNFILSNITYILILVFAITLFFYLLNRKIKVTKKIKKEDKLMYLDVMTNLKNRNFLNDNIEYWEANKVYPQAIVTIDLNKIKEINDTYGHEEGDNQIKAAANILIKTQRENSEIIRTDGNEFLVYMVGYEEKVILTYMHKLNKEFNNLPKPYGAAIGYSMIEDEIKTIDDAINEALIMMRKNKGE